MKVSQAYSIAIALLFFSGTAVGQFDYDFFWSDRNLNQGAVNQNLEVTVQVGQEIPLYLYWSTNGPVDSDISVGCAVDVSTSQSGIISFDSAETLEFDITVTDFPVGTRWMSADGNGGYGGGGLSGPAYDVSPDFIDRLWAFTISNQGIRESNSTASPFLDEGYDVDADAFLFGQLRLTALQPGTVQLITVTDESQCVNGAEALQVTHALVTIVVEESDVLLGDVNLDGIVNLLDVSPFVQILSDLEYQAEADINQDGLVNLEDVPPFVKLLTD